MTIKPPLLRTGASVRNYYILKFMRSKNTTLFCKDSDESNGVTRTWKNLNKIYLFKVYKKTILNKLFYYFQFKIPYLEYNKFNNIDLTKLKTDKGIIWFAELESYFLLKQNLDKLNYYKILDAHNVDYIRLKSEMNTKSFAYKMLSQPFVIRLKYEEIKAIKKMDHIIVCSDVDKKYFAKYIPENKITVIPNGVDCNNFKPTKETNSNTVLFMGKLNYPPNLDGIVYYIEKIHPILKQKLKNIRLNILGLNPPKELIKLANKDRSIVIKGFVKDVRSELKKAKICICPVRYGSGTRLKILEYMAMNRPVVSTAKGAEGLRVTDDKDILLADSPGDFANSIIKLVDDTSLYAKIATNARKLVEKEYDWIKIAKIINLLFIKEKLL